MIKSLGVTKILSFNKVFNTLSLLCNVLGVVLQTILDVYIYKYKINVRELYEDLDLFVRQGSH
jgi:hypothetical protein